jgi:AraC family transcriptional regulator of adaptative response/methylated-DNA-[protein]-cysteine methyltransferase
MMMTMPRERQTETREDAERWRAVQRRDRTSDGRFVYGVSSTGVFCRPSCPSRRPTRARVTFFDAALDAERAGFRPCRRCKPKEAPFDPWIDRITRACLYLANVDGHPTLTTLARRFGGSPYHFQRTFKRIVGLTPREYAEACRLRVVRRRLHEDDAITSAVFDAGYGSSSRFYERAAPKLGMSPTNYQQGGAGMSIDYAVVDSCLGRLLVAATPRGVCSVAMGKSDRDLERVLTEEYPAASIARGGEALEQWTGAIVAHLDGRRPRLDLPIDVQATSFQWQVWKALAEIPSGETRTYGEVAAAIGRPRAVRAVGHACAVNKVAILIPCHRVVPKAGGVGNYRWGADRKKALLARERRS